MSKAVRIAIDQIEIGERLRPINDDWVHELARLIEQDGLLTPVILRKADQKLILVSGLQRLEACKRLGRTEIVAEVKQLSAREASRLEILENLAQKRLMPLEESEHYSRLKGIHAHQNPHAGHGGDRKSKEFRGKNQVDNLSTWSFIMAVSGDVDCSERDIRRKVRRWEGLTPVVRAQAKHVCNRLSGTDLDKLVQLDAGVQVSLVEAMREQLELPFAKALEAVRATENPVFTSNYDRLLAAWASADQQSKAQFIAYLQDIGVVNV
ncbi:MAG: ParB N-terminal domain-containing protein [Pseudomonadota bacterium]